MKTVYALHGYYHVVTVTRYGGMPVIPKYILEIRGWSLRLFPDC